ncbi:MAG: hypothetical protein RI897_3120 [Verrucomicrobiota bacterium]
MGMALRSMNPATGEEVRRFESYSVGEVRRRLEVAVGAQVGWRKLSVGERGERVGRLAGVLRAGAGGYARLMAEEMGKPVKQGLAEVEKCAWACEYFAARSGDFLGVEALESDGGRAYVCWQPLGVVLAVMPWNFPFWQVFRCAVPALMAGNCVVLKHASNVMGCGLVLEEIFREAGLSGGEFQNLVVGSDRVGEVLAHGGVRGVALTGSTEAGRSLAADAGRHLLKLVLELGGSDAYVVLEDADLGAAAAVCAAARLVNSGQSCVAAKRFIVVDSVVDEFERLLVGEMGRYRVGDPLDAATDLGPLARVDLRDGLHDQVVRSVGAGARCLSGGEVPGGVGAFYPPTVLGGVRPGMAVFDEETFGPVAAVVSVAGEEEAIRLANQSEYGLGAAVFSGDRERGERVAMQLEAGCCVVNGQVKSDPRQPFGGIKASGYGRELGLLGIREFTNAKTIVVG